MLACAIGLSTLGCEARIPGSSTTEVDSAGVRIVTNEAPLENWALDEKPELLLGAVDDGGPTQFFQVEAAAFLSDHAFVVANRGTEELRFFDTTGAFLGSTGGPGHGPEEFTGLSWLGVGPDSLLTYDWGNDRLSVRSSSGAYARSFRLEWISGLLSPVALLTDGTLLGLSVRHMTEIEEAGTLEERGLVSRYDLDGRMIDSVGRFIVGERVVHREGNLQTTIDLPLGASASFAAAPPGFCYTLGEHLEVQCFDPEGRLGSIVRVDSVPRRVEPEDIEEAFRHEIDQARSNRNEPREQALRRARGSMVFPTTFPAFTDLLSDDRGRLWARRYAMPDADLVEWWVFDGGVWVGRVSVDASFTLLDVRADRVLGVRRDDLGVERVALYRFGGA